MSTATSDAGTVTERLYRARHRGYGGGLIPAHRAFVTLPFSPIGLVVGALLVAGFLAGLAFAMRPIGEGYLWLYGRIIPLLDPAARVSAASFQVMGPIGFRLPYVDAIVGLPGPGQWLVLAAITSVVLVVSLFLRPGLLPLAYALRVAGALQATSLVYFHFSTRPFPYTLPTYSLEQMLACLAAVAGAPVLLGLTYYVFQFPWRLKASLTAALMGHLLILVPLQGLVVVGLLRAGSLAVLPLLFIFLGLLPEVMVFVAFYGWGMSWSSRVDARP